MHDEPTTTQTAASTTCLVCGYNLTGVPTAGACPECGTDINSEALSAAVARWFTSRTVWTLRKLPPATALLLDQPELRRRARRRILIGIVIPTVILCLLSCVLRMIVVEKTVDRWITVPAYATTTQPTTKRVHVEQRLLDFPSLEGWVDLWTANSTGFSLPAGEHVLAASWRFNPHGWSQQPLQPTHIGPPITVLGMAAGSVALALGLRLATHGTRCRVPLSVALSLFVLPCLLAQLAFVAQWIDVIHKARWGGVVFSAENWIRVAFFFTPLIVALLSAVFASWQLTGSLALRCAPLRRLMTVGLSTALFAMTCIGTEIGTVWLTLFLSGR